MNSSVLKIIATGSVAVVLILLAATDATAQQRRRRGAASQQTIRVELNAKSGRGKVDRNLGQPLKARGNDNGGVGNRLCTMEIINQTQFRVRVYVNERYRETLAARETAKFPENAGRVKIYSRTERDTRNRFNYWGPGYYTCGDNERDGSILLLINNKNL